MGENFDTNTEFKYPEIQTANSTDKTKKEKIFEFLAGLSPALVIIPSYLLVLTFYLGAAGILLSIGTCIFVAFSSAINFRNKKFIFYGNILSFIIIASFILAAPGIVDRIYQGKQ